MSTITLQDAQDRLLPTWSTAWHRAILTITENDRPIARLIARARRSGSARPGHGRRSRACPRQGGYEGRLIVPDDFKEPLEEMREYME